MDKQNIDYKKRIHELVEGIEDEEVARSIYQFTFYAIGLWDKDKQ